jgi:hypothetical protein
MRTAFTALIIGTAALSISAATATDSRKRLLHPSDEDNNDDGDDDRDKWDITRDRKKFGKIKV